MARFTPDAAAPLSGDVTTTGPGGPATLATVVVAATVGDATHIPVVTYDAKGRVTATSTAAIAAGGGDTFAYFMS